jgi:hypothetical protein
VTVVLVTSEGDVSTGVSWDVTSCGYDPAKTDEQTFSVSGNVSLPDGLDNPGNVSLTVSVPVTVRAKPASGDEDTKPGVVVEPPAVTFENDDVKPAQNPQTIAAPDDIGSEAFDRLDGLSAFDDASGIFMANTVTMKNHLSPEAANAVDFTSDDVMVPLPLVTAEVSPDKIAVITLKTPLDAFEGRTLGEIVLLKFTSEDETVVPTRIDDLAKIQDMQYVIADEGNNVLGSAHTIIADKQYRFIVAVKDNGEYDWDPDGGHVVDPLAVAPAKEKEQEPERSGSSGGGCSAGAFGMAPFFALALAAVAKAGHKRGSRK